MTISTARTGRMTIGELVELAWQQAGLVNVGQSPSETQKSFGRKRLQVLLDNLEVRGEKVRCITSLDVPMAVGVESYDLPTWVRDVGQTAVYLDAAQDLFQPNTVLPLGMVSRDDYERLGQYDTTGTPSSIWIDRSGAPAVLKVWPPPDELGTVRLQVLRHLADVDSDTVTVELEPHWDEALLNYLCEKLTVASNAPPERATYFRRLAMESQAIAEEASSDQANSRIQLEVC